MPTRPAQWTLPAIWIASSTIGWLPSVTSGGGAVVSSAAKPTEFKQVTVQTMTELVERCAAVANRYAGWVDKFTGGGMMAMSGTPAALLSAVRMECVRLYGVVAQTQSIDGSSSRPTL